jgi:hypothetical protein
MHDATIKKIVTFTISQPVMLYLRENLNDKFCSNNARTENYLKEENTQYAGSPILPEKLRRALNKVFIRY